MADKLKLEIIIDDKGTVVVKGLEGTTKKAFNDMERHAKKSATSMGESLKTVKAHWLAITAAMGGAVYAAKKCIDAASNLQEVHSKFNVVFEDQVGLATQWAKVLVDSYAMSRREAEQFLSSTQDLLKPMGMATAEAARMSNEIVKLSADLGSFNNLPTAQVMADIQSALVGNFETMKKYGVVLNATVVQEKALAMGLAKTKDELTFAHRAQAAYKLMVEGSKDAIGDMARTSDQYANTLKRAKAGSEDLAATIGNILMPPVRELASLWARAQKALAKSLEFAAAASYETNIVKALSEELLQHQKRLAEIQSAAPALIEQMGTKYASTLTKQILAEKEAIKVLKEKIDLMTRRGYGPSGGAAPAIEKATVDQWNAASWAMRRFTEAEAGAWKGYEEFTGVVKLKDMDITNTATLWNNLSEQAEQNQARQAASVEKMKETLEQYQGYLDMNLERNAARSQKEIDDEQRLADIKTKTRQAYFAAATTMANAFYEASGRQSKALFLMAKAAAIAEAIVYTHVAAAAALKFGPAYSAAITALGYANVAMIIATTIGTLRGGGAFGGAPVSTAVGTYPASPTTGAPELEGKPRIEVHIHGNVLGNEAAGQEIADWLNQAVEGYGTRLVASEVA